MKYKILSTLLMVCLLLVSPHVLAITPTKIATDAAKTVTVTPTLSPEDKDIQNLKDRVATKVAELRKKDQKALSGSVTDVKSNSVRMKTADEAAYDVKIDDTLTKVFQVVGTSKKEAKRADIKKGSYIIVTGPVLDKSITANDIYLDEQFIVASGKIIEVNKTDFYIDVITSDKDTYSLDIESKTQIAFLDIKTLDLVKNSFSKLKDNDTVHFVARKSAAAKNNRYTTDKLLVIPQEYFQK